MKWWGVVLLVLLVCGVGVGAFFLGRLVFPEKPSVAEVAQAADSTQDAKKDKEGAKAASAGEKKGDQKESSILPTLPRLKRYLKPVKTRDMYSQRYALVHTMPSWRAQTGYGPPADVHEKMFSRDVFLGAPRATKKRVYKPGMMRESGLMKFQVEFGVYSSYKKAVARFKMLQKQMHDPLVICDLLDRKGGVRYAVRLRAPMGQAEAQDYISYCVEAVDVVARVVPYAF